MTSEHSSVARLGAALARIADPALQGDTVFTGTFPAAALREAEAADARAAAADSRGPLDGRIISAKALFDIAGAVTTSGSTLLRSQAPARADAAAITRVRQAGGVLIGRTHMTEFAFSAVGVNPHDGSPGNPFNRSLIAGGSSTGAAISVASDMAEIALGSDTGGSIRIPAALCGIVGFKGTSGQAPLDGVFPLSQTLDVIGPLARSVADCAAAHAVLTGATSQPLAQTALADVSLTVVRGRLFEDVEPAVRTAIDDALAHLKSGGTTITEGAIEAELDALAALDGIGFFPAVELLTTLTEMGFSQFDALDPRTAARVEAGRSLTAVSYIRMQRARRTLIAMMRDRLSGGEILALPTVPITAVPIASVEDPAEFHRVNMALLRNTRVANLFDLPAISLPVRSMGAPVGLMLMGARGDDLRLLRVAQAVETALARQ